MLTIKEAAQSFLDSGLNILPVKKNKRPALSEWEKFKTELYPDDLPGFDKAWGIGVICGEVSEGLECIDFDPKVSKEHIRGVFNAFCKEPDVKSIMNRHKVYIQKTQSGGYHFVYRYEFDEKRDGNKKLAKTKDGKDAIIESRGEGGYFIAAPSPGYESKLSTLCNIGIMSIDERDFLIHKAKSFCMDDSQSKEENNGEEENHFDNTDPVSYFNWKKADYAKALLKDNGWELVSRKEVVEQWRRPGKKDGISATWGYKYNTFYVFSTSADPFEHECYYTPFQILVKLRFKNSYPAAINWILRKYYQNSLPFIRVGVDYFKIIEKENRYGIVCRELKPWKKDEIKMDHGPRAPEFIEKFDDFIISPSNKNYQAVVNNNYNLFREFVHKPAKGDITWTMRLMEHVFGEQLNLGLRYMKLLYEFPHLYGPILVLVSSERSTGKTTFLNYVSMLFGDNVASISPEDLASSFNVSYATKNITLIDETVIEGTQTVEKLKALSTQREMTINQKFVSQYKIPFFGKFILTSNKEDKFAKIDQEETRFFIRKLGEPAYKNYQIENDLMNEIPAFIYYLENEVPEIDFSVGRVPFTVEELTNESLIQVKDNSHTWLYKDMIDKIRDYFFNQEQKDEFRASIKDIIDEWYSRNNNVTVSYMKQVLKDEMKKEPSERVIRYIQFSSNNTAEVTKTGTPFTFRASEFLTEAELTERIDPVDEGVENEPPF